MQQGFWGRSATWPKERRALPCGCICTVSASVLVMCCTHPDVVASFGLRESWRLRSQCFVVARQVPSRALDHILTRRTVM